jgi:hypothetical protein
MWGLAFAYLARGRKTPLRLLHGLRARETAEEVRVRLPQLSAAAAGLLTLLAGPLVLVCAVALCAGPSPSVAVMVVAWAVLLGSAGLIYRTVATRSASGKADLVIDRVRQTLRRPRAGADGGVRDEERP